MRWFSNLRIRYKLLVSYATVFALSMSLGSYIIYTFVRQTIEAGIESELENSTTTILNMVRTAANVSIRNHLRAVAEKNREIALNFYERWQAGEISESEAKHQAGRVMRSQTIGTTGYIYCIDSFGKVLIHPERALLGADISRFDFVRDQKLRKIGYLEYDWQNPGEDHPRPKALYMTYFEPWDWIISASSYRSEFRQLIDVTDFEEGILSLTFGQTGYSYIMDSRGNLILHPAQEGNYYGAQDRKGHYFIQEICARKNGKITYPWENPGENIPREKLVIFNYIPEFDWIVASSSYLDEFYAPLKMVRSLIVATVVIFMLLVLPITLRLSSSITHPLRELMQQFSKGAQGDISVRMQRRSRDEIGHLARYFNSFMERLEAYSDDLRGEIADRRRAEAAIRRSEAKYRELVQNANSIILRMDTQGRITFFNEFSQTFFQFSEAEALGAAVTELIVPEGSGDFLAAAAATGADQAAFGHFEFANRRRDGRRVWIAWTSKAIAGAAGAVAEYLCVGNDITESRLAERETSRLRHYLQNIIDSMPSILVGVDRNGRVTQWNREAERVTRLTSEAAIGRPVVEVLPHLQANSDQIRPAVEKQQATLLEKVVFGDSDRITYVNIMIYPLTVHEVAGAVIRVDDITDRVRLENTMVQTEKMMSVGGLAAGMAHEINNPLGGILQSLQNIQRRLSDELAVNHSEAEACGTSLGAIRTYLEQRRVLKFLDGIRVSGERASHIVQNMLSFSRRSEARKAPVALSRLLDKSVELAAHDYDLRKRFDFRDIRIQREYAPDLPEVPCVATEIEQVVLNLLRNAAQAMTETMAQRAPEIVLTTRRHLDQALITIADNGPGIPPDLRSRVFEPFFTTKDVGIGTGLGLSVSYFIITSHHGGQLSLESDTDQGTCFTIRLPLSAASHPPGHTIAPPTDLTAATSAGIAEEREIP
ncbi:MAG: cache domain-containing protein [Desulfosarcinaceae bacterium]|nr:cache domain-containing protein [Desulfosarcinaceae bacterium]